MSFAIRNLAMTFQFDWPFNMGDKLRKHTDKKIQTHLRTYVYIFLNVSYCTGFVLNFRVKTEPKLAKNTSI